MDTSLGGLKTRVDLLSLAGRDTALKRVANTGGGEYAGACPFCGGEDRFRVQPAKGIWLCRHCTDGKWRDAIDYIQRRDGLSFREALHTLGGQIYPNKTLRIPEKEPTPMPSDAWRAETWRLVDEANLRLIRREGVGEVVAEYLERRGLFLPTWCYWLLGAVEWQDPRAKKTRPAVCIPIFQPDNLTTLCGVKFRFVDEVDGGLRYISLKGSQAMLYGDCLPAPCLLVVEGEINMLSIWQTHPKGWRVMSVGSQSFSDKILQSLKTLTFGAMKVYVWFDDDERARQVGRQIGAEKAIISQGENGKVDANDLLRRGKLVDFLEQKLETTCLGMQ
jgi:hypothetical protein